MRVTTFDPDERLAAFVKGVRVIETDVEATRALIPEAGLVAAFRYRGSARDLEAGPECLPDAAPFGLRRTARRMCTSAGGGVVVVSFLETGAAAFFDWPLHHLFQTTVDVHQLAPREQVSRVLERIARARHGEERILAVQDFLCERLRAGSRADRDELVLAAVRALRATHGSLRIEQLSDELGISRDRFEKRFRRIVGASPKQFATILRLHRAMGLHRQGANLTELSHTSGYFDQSHFIRDFRAFTGEAPRRFFETVEHC